VVAKLPERSSLALCRETVFVRGKRSYMEITCIGKELVRDGVVVGSSVET
jgi:hypothetical protein